MVQAHLFSKVRTMLFQPNPVSKKTSTNLALSQDSNDSSHLLAAVPVECEQPAARPELSDEERAVLIGKTHARLMHKKRTPLPHESRPEAENEEFVTAEEVKPPPEYTDEHDRQNEEYDQDHAQEHDQEHDQEQEQEHRGGERLQEVATTKRRHKNRQVEVHHLRRRVAVPAEDRWPCETCHCMNVGLKSTCTFCGTNKRPPKIASSRTETAFTDANGQAIRFALALPAPGQGINPILQVYTDDILETCVKRLQINGRSGIVEASGHEFEHKVRVTGRRSKCHFKVNARECGKIFAYLSDLAREADVIVILMGESGMAAPHISKHRLRFFLCFCF
eukprot:NODE_13563_length_1159_cov_1.452519.p1 GENE.NODE_13563_length_1159_cov_1.452519~~NODE_13563_length_1159_cov_1.452519.p1  ORF type:complete len:386 (-),score=75.25 NODE_13563_length_1159_cov_1.452519:2-1006(-)